MSAVQNIHEDTTKENTMSTQPTTRKPGTEMIYGGGILLLLAFALLFAPMNLVLPSFIAALGIILTAIGFGRRILHAIENRP